MKPVKVVLSPEAEEVYNYLNVEANTSKTEKTILNAVNKKIDILKTNFHYGNPIAKDKIPDEYKNRYDAKNLFRIELPSFWRMLYTLTNDDSEVFIIAFVLDIIDHDKYNKKFGYNKK